MAELAFKAFLTLFVVIDPIGLVPIFIGLAGTLPIELQRALARKSVLVAAGATLIFGLIGSPLLQAIGISLDALRVAGGLLLFRIGFDMVFAQNERETPEEEAEARSKQDISIFPLAIPLIAGPGTLVSILILTTEAHSLGGLALVLVIALLVFLIAYGFLRASSSLASLLGRTGVNVVGRILGLLLAALAVQYVADGVHRLLA
jgi:multiple antibiotic resistance protein